MLFSNNIQYKWLFFAVVLFSKILRAIPRKHFHFNLHLFLVMKTSEKS